MRASRHSRRSGFTLIEVLVATLIMAVAVSALLSNLSTSTFNLMRTSDADRLTYLAKRKMDELMTVQNVPRGAPIQGVFEVDENRKPISGWRARVMPYRASQIRQQERLETVELETWLQSGSKRRTLILHSYRIVGAK